MLSLAQQLTDTMQLFFGSLDQSIHKEFVYIADYIARTRTEISKLRPNDIKEQRIPTAGAELEAVVTDTERATESIMAEAEALLDSKPDDLAAYKTQVDEAMMRVIEACSFQDLSGQRVSKVVESLRHVEKRVSRFAATMGVHDAEADEDELAETERKKKAAPQWPCHWRPGGRTGCRRRADRVRSRPERHRRPVRLGSAKPDKENPARAPAGFFFVGSMRWGQAALGASTTALCSSSRTTVGTCWRAASALMAA